MNFTTGICIFFLTIASIVNSIGYVQQDEILLERIIAHDIILLERIIVLEKQVKLLGEK